MEPLTPRSLLRQGVNGRDSDDVAVSPLTISRASIVSLRDSDAGTEPADHLERMATACRTLLECLGEDPEREGLVKTPMRMAKALLALTSGYSLVRCVMNHRLVRVSHILLTTYLPPPLSFSHRIQRILLQMPCSNHQIVRWYWLRISLVIQCVNITCYLFLVLSTSRICPRAASWA